MSHPKRYFAHKNDEISSRKNDAIGPRSSECQMKTLRSELEAADINRSSMETGEICELVKASGQK